MRNTILSHRSIRKYKPDSIPEKILEDILRSGIYASTTGNMQLYSMVVSKEVEIRKLLWEVHFKQDMVLQAPVHITFCADFNRFNLWCRLRNAEPGYGNFLSFFTAAIDALLVSQNISLAAEYHGLGICYLGTATYNADRLIEILNLPRQVVPVAAIVMGYSDENPGTTDRLPLEAVLHKEKYRNFTDELIDEIYRLRESSEQTKQLLELNKKETLAQIFTDNRYTKKDNEFFSTKYLEVIRKQGFLEPENLT
jgi:nitroreductase